MKRLTSSVETAQLGLLKSRLENAGIQCELRNEFSSQAMPGPQFETELWVIRDADYHEATTLLEEWSQPRPTSQSGESTLLR